MKYSQLLFGYNLPKEIQDLISEYNVDHRSNFNKVLEEIKQIYSLTCEGCNITKYSKSFTSYIMDSFVCSRECKNIYIDSLPPHMQKWYKIE